ncbi:FCD domain-containing protein [Amycolatopsis tolypomycina]|uniref:FCD domain-containing protein n=1 Tax=Amycolatopsis tolypomycina TaxID=208445 RepID=A0A1H4XCB0_9PSEU|nr:GntR family transcriptional regulator [Amycolatopsis tolypomycina]SED03233.1 FCD domain-containing protein [Amycolatopsis tolypomycina]
MTVPLRGISARDALVAEIRRHILSGELKPGEPLTEVGVARPTVRSALQELLARHLAERTAGRSLRVPVLTAGDVRDLFFVRTPLEPAAVRRIVEDQRPVTAAEAGLAAMEAVAPGASWGDRVDAHSKFHIALVGCAGSPRRDRIYPGAGDLAAEHRVPPAAVRSEDGERV